MLRSLTTVVMPYWTYNAITRNKKNWLELLENNTLKDVLGLYDLAELEWTDRNYNWSSAVCESTDICSCYLPITEDSYNLSKSVTISSSVTTRLSSTIGELKSVIDDEEYKPYSFIQLPNYVLVVLNCDFITSIKNTKTYLTYLKDYLKELHKQKSIEAVCRTELFDKYTRLLHALSVVE